MMKMKCELCMFRAKIFCESDQANLCWTCDANVHSANFLVARHSRTLLCRTCNSLTPWKATGAVLATAISVCNRCVEGGGEADKETYFVDTDSEHEDSHNNQAVPWSPTTPPPPIPTASSSGSNEWVSGDGITTTTTATSLKLQHDDFASDRDFKTEHDGEPPLMVELRPLKLNG